MKRKRKLLSNRAIVAIVAVLCVSGYALSASGHFDDPVIALRDTVAMNTLLTGADSFALPPSSSSSGITLTALDTSSDTALPALPNLSTLPTDSTSSDSSLSLPPLDSLSSAAATDSSLSLPPLDSLSSADAAPDDSGIRWNEIGDVLFDLWFLAAVTAFVIVFQHALGFVRVRLAARPVLRPSAAR